MDGNKMEGNRMECEYCRGDGGRYDDEIQDQWYWCEYCDASKQHYKRIRKSEVKMRKIKQENIDKVRGEIAAANKSCDEAFTERQTRYWDGYHDGLLQALILLEIHDEN
jgi:hypothetical protein